MVTTVQKLTLCSLLFPAMALCCVSGAEITLAPPPRPVASTGNTPESEEEANYKRALLLIRTMEMLRARYVDSDKVSYGKLFDHAMQGMISALDPYSDYETPREFTSQQIRRTGELVGIGAMAVKPEGRPVTLIRILPGTPAEKAGLKPGDQIIAIDGEKIHKLNLTGALKKLRGISGTTVKLQIRRNDQVLHPTLVRRKVQTPSVVPGSVRLFHGKIGYLKLTSFTGSTPGEVEAALKKLHALKAEAIIMDLRYNPGGVVDAGVKTASFFLPPGKVVFRAKARDKESEKKALTRNSAFCDTVTPLLLLTNEYTASCSEILAGALQDHKRARLLGVRTFGKGTILHVVPVPGGGAVRFAAAHYVTPGGRVIEKKGLIPDIEVRLPSRAVMILSGQSLRYPGMIRPPHRGAVEDLQLRRAVGLLMRELKNKAVSP